MTNAAIESRRVFLIRHGSANGTDGRCIGHTDVPLSDAGRAQCATLAAAWSPPAATLVWCSDLARASESAALLVSAWGARVTAMHVEPRLRECAFGEWDGRTWDELASSDGARLDAWMHDWTSVAPPGGESLPDLSARAVEMLHRIVHSEQSSHVVVAHAGVLRAMLCHVTGSPHASAFTWAMPHAHVSALTLRPAAAVQEMVQGTVDWLHAFPPPLSERRPERSV